VIFFRAGNFKNFIFLEKVFRFLAFQDFKEFFLGFNV